ncbi:crossover junction endodeoxyribonuclease RuvC [Anaeromyxobacter sp. SG66]|uniref:crossover junction endodeoxyribonuclease RuvC n=2 Tax=unclassified Anaeromyxobacter TaxID=2620896 RepID=UPI001F5A70FC|nr:crossover junction endodeoxyribonuclease RuvC [Anaeromyxobacter sp. SG66]
MIALGIDPGSRRCGYGVVAREGTRLVVLASGVLVPGADRPMAERLARILEGLAEVIRRSGPAEVSVEQVFCGVSARSALVLGQARGVALAAAAQAGLPVFEYAPSEVKLAFTGSGRASKDQMLRTARMLLGAAPDLSDEADALAVAVCHLARRAGRLALPSVRNVAVAVPSAGRAREDAVAPVPARDRAARAAARLRPSRRDHRRLA